MSQLTKRIARRLAQTHPQAFGREPDPKPEWGWRKAPSTTPKVGLEVKLTVPPGTWLEECHSESADLSSVQVRQETAIWGTIEEIDEEEGALTIQTIDGWELTAPYPAAGTKLEEVEPVEDRRYMKGDDDWDEDDE